MGNDPPAIHRRTQGLGPGWTSRREGAGRCDTATGKAMVFPVVKYHCQSWTIKKAEHQEIDAFEL